jgi:hypothetical protein
MLVKKREKRSNTTEIKNKLDELCKYDLEIEILITYHVFHAYIYISIYDCKIYKF